MTKKGKGVVFGALLAFLLASGGVAFWYFGTGRGDGTPGSSQRAAPRIALPDSSGKIHGLEEVRGHWVIVHFWASWCPPCLGEIDNFVALARKMEASSLRFVAISTDSKWEDALKVLPNERLPKGMLSLMDASAKVPEEYGTYQYPETYLLSPDLKIAAKWVGVQEWPSAEMVSQLGELEKRTGPGSR